MATLQDLLAQRAEIQKSIEQLQNAERSKAIDEIKKLMSDHNITLADITAGGKVSKSATRADGTPKQAVAPKYRQPETGETWSGRGLQPKWLKAAIAGGATLESFAI